MIQENELITLLITLGVFFFFLHNYFSKPMRGFPFKRIFLASLTFFVLGQILTIVEGFLFPDLLNTIEHFSYLLFTIFLIIWFLKIKRGDL